MIVYEVNIEDATCVYKEERLDKLFEYFKDLMDNEGEGVYDFSIEVKEMPDEDYEKLPDWEL